MPFDPSTMVDISTIPPHRPLDVPAPDKHQREVMAEYARLNGGQANTLEVTFYVEAVRNDRLSDGWWETGFNMETGEPFKKFHPGAGRAIYEDKEHIEIRAPGNTLEIRRREVREIDKVIYAPQYNAFKNAQSAPNIGTPLGQLPFLTKSQVLEFAATGIKTVEGLASCADSDGQKFMDFHRTRQRAKDFLALAKDQAPMDSMRAELAQRDAEIEAMKKQIASLTEKQSPADTPPKRRGRPPKVKPGPEQPPA